MTNIVRIPSTHPLNTIVRSDSSELEKTLLNFLNKSERVDTSSFKWPKNVKLPETFEGKRVWKDFLSPVKNQDTCGGCYAYATTSSLADRFNLRTRGALHLDLSASRIILCDLIGQSAGTGGDRQVEIGAKVQRIFGCFGNSLLEAWRYLYSIGTNSTVCFPENTNKTCEQVVGPFYDTCADDITPAVFYRASDVYLVPSKPEDGGSELMMREDIYRFGPLTTALYVYENFYTFNPKKEMYRPAGNRTGGHAVVIDGWGVENGVEFWWVRNSWGPDWGIDGYFKIERGVNMCACEENVVAGMPDVGDDITVGSLFRNIFEVERIGILLQSQVNFFGGIDPTELVSRRHLAYEGRSVGAPAWRSKVIGSSEFVAGKIQSTNYIIWWIAILVVGFVLIFHTCR